LFVNSSGNVGIGISPTTTLDVGGNLRLHNSALTTNRRFELRSTQGYSSFIQFTEDNIADRWSFGVANGDGSLIFKTGAEFTGTERLRLDSSGRLGLGTSTPSFLLDVNGGQGRIIPSGGSANSPDTGVGTLNVYGASSPITTRTGALRIETYSNQGANVGNGIAFSSRYADSDNPSYTIAKIGGYKTNATSGSGAGYLAFATSHPALSLAS
jgi:hypothetical protein